MAEKRLDIIIGARNLAAQAFAQAQQQVRSLMGSAAQSNNALFSPAAIQATSAAMRGIAGVVSSIRGGLEAANEAIASMPFGIGAMHSALTMLIGELGGFNAEMDRLRKLAAENAKETEANNRKAAAAMASQEQARDLEQQIELASARNDLEKELIRLNQERLRQVAQANAAYAAGAGPAQLRAAVEAADKLADIGHRRAIEKDRAEVAEAEEKAQNDRMKKALDAETDLAEALARYRSELKQRELQAAGKALDAELEQIRESYRKRREEARSLEESELLERLQAADEAAAQRAAMQAERRPGAAGGQYTITESFRGYSLARPEQATADAIKAQKPILEKIQQGVEDVARGLSRVEPVGWLLN